MAESIDEPNQFDPALPEDILSMPKSKNSKIWYTSGVLEYILLTVAIAIILAFLIPSSKYKIWIYFISLIIYAIVIFYVYFWSVKDDKRGMRLVLIFFIFLLLLSQLFHYYTTNNVVAIIMYSLTLIALIYIIVRGFKTWFTIAMILPLLFITYQLLVQILDIFYPDLNLPT